MIRTQRNSGQQRGGNGIPIRILIALAFAAFSLFSYFSSSQYNDVTGEDQRVSMTPNQEIALGLQSVPSLVQEFGGEYRDSEVQDAIDEIGFDLVRNSVAADTPWQWEFTVLDSNVLNAFALPGGQVFITTEMLSQLETIDAVAGVLSHEIVHVLARHGAQRVAQNDLTNGLLGAVSVASGNANATQTAAMIAQLVNLQYGREDELQSDSIGVCLMIDAGYDPQGMVEVQQILAQASAGASQPEFFSSHPNPDNRIQRIQEAIDTADEFCPQ
ncbi:MAG: M48 family metallopeptidase [Phototrophicaceae bacterium]